MSIISQNSENEVAVLDCVQRFFSSHRVGSLLKKCNGTKEKGIPAISLLLYKLSNIFVGRSMYMQHKEKLAHQIAGMKRKRNPKRRN